MENPFDKAKVQVREISIQNQSRKTVTTETATLLGIRILKCSSLVTLSNLLSREETNYLVASSLEAAAKQKQTLFDSVTNNNKNNDDDDTSNNLETYNGPGRFCIRMPTISAANRHDIPDAGSEDLHDPLPESISLFIEERIIQRVLNYIDEELPDIRKTLFGTNCNSLLKLFLEKKLEWSCREPAVNVYYPPNGYFGIHKDKKALTILMPLTSPEDDDFTGGGTAFWSEAYPDEMRHEPSLVMAPKSGTALLFGGNVSHKGLPIETGNRVVFVASFSRKPNKKQKKMWTVSAR